MKKRLIFIQIIILLSSILMADTFYVGQGESIQAALNSADPTDIIILTGTHYDIQETLIIPMDNLTLKSNNTNPEDCIIDGNNSVRILDIHQVSGFALENICIQNGYHDDDSEDYAAGISYYHSWNNVINNCLIENCITPSGLSFGVGGIKCETSSLTISNLEANNNEGSGYGFFKFISQESGYQDDLIITNSIIANNNGNRVGGIYGYQTYGAVANLTLDNCLFVNNIATTVSGSTGAIRWSDGYHQGGNSSVSISNTTISDNEGYTTGGIYVDNTNINLKTLNSIIWENVPSQLDCSGQVEVTYSNIEDGFTGTGNIDENPQFEDPGNVTLYQETHGYGLTDASPCVDTGDPSYPADPDETTIDMGCFYFEHFYDIHRLSKGYNWESFSRIGTEPNGNVPTNIIPILYNIDPFGDITSIIFDAYEGDDLTWDLTFFWSDDPYFTQSSWLYKIEILPGEERILTVYGERLPDDFPLSDEEPLEAGTYHWLGFWLPRPQKMIESFGDYWQYVEKVKSEDWYFNKCSIARGGDPYGGEVVISAEGLTISPGKGYMVWFKDLPQPITDFQWTLSDAVEEPVKKSEPENFTYTEKADYEAIDVFNIPPSVTEIGVFEDDICVGAVVVEDTCAQILVYSDNANRDPIPFTLEVVTGRGFSTPVKNYQVLDLETGKFESKSIISGRQEYSILRFGDEDEPEDNSLSTPQLHGNYPNPFNPTTTIEFSVTQNSDFVTLEIYNIKGQKVKTLYSGIAEEGKHSILWDGKDTNEKSVGTGIYFYKLKTGKKEISRKMLLLK
jgi:hypothetical protein